MQYLKPFELIGRLEFAFIVHYECRSHYETQSRQDNNDDNRRIRTRRVSAKRTCVRNVACEFECGYQTHNQTRDSNFSKYK